MAIRMPRSRRLLEVLAQRVDDQRHVGLGELEHQPGRRHPVLASAPSTSVGQAAGLQLPSGDVDVHGRAPARRAGLHQPAAIRHDSCSTRRPIGIISALDSATSRNSPGPSTPRSGWFQRSSVSTATIRPVAQVQHRLAVHHQLVGAERGLQLRAQPAAARGPGLLLRVGDRRPGPGRPAWRCTSAVSAAASTCSALLCPSAVARPMLALMVKVPDGSRNGSRSDFSTRSATAARSASSVRSVQMMANSSPPSRPTVSPGRTEAPQPAGDLDQQLVAGGVPGAVVDLLEPVQVEVGHPDPGAGPDAGGQARARTGPAAGCGWPGRSGRRAAPGGSAPPRPACGR